MKPDWKEAAAKYADLRLDRWLNGAKRLVNGDDAHVKVGAACRVVSYASFIAGAEHGYEEGYDDGLLKGSEVGDATAKRALKERDLDMERLQKERIEFVTERDQLKQQAESREETNRQVSTALVHAYAEIERLEQRLEDAEALLNKIVEMNLQTAEHQYGDKTKAENWACVRLTREYFSKHAGGDGK